METALMLLKLTGTIVTGIVSLRIVQQCRWGWCKDTRSLKGKTIVVTGANCGLGAATVKNLVQRDARVILACRNTDSGQQLIDQIRSKTTSGEMVVKKLDLSSFKSIQDFVDDLKSSEKNLDILINNAGIYQTDYSLSQDGYELQFAVNHLGHFLLTNLLLQKLRASAPSRVIIVSSSLYKKGKIDLDNLSPSKEAYNKKSAYNNSKLANMLFALELSKRVSSGLTICAVSPGLCWTNLHRHLNLPIWKLILMLPVGFLFVRSANQGCQTIIHCAVTDELKNGQFYRDCGESKVLPIAIDEVMSEKLWETSKKMCKI